MNFVKFPTDSIEACIEFMRRLTVKHRQRQDNSCTSESGNNSDDEAYTGDLNVVATGGGAYKFYDQLKQVLRVEVMREDEMECLIIGKSPENRSWIS
jgi:type II pantothenate kinase